MIMVLRYKLNTLRMRPIVKTNNNSQNEKHFYLCSNFIFGKLAHFSAQLALRLWRSNIVIILDWCFIGLSALFIATGRTIGQSIQIMVRRRKRTRKENFWDPKLPKANFTHQMNTECTCCNEYSTANQGIIQENDSHRTRAQSLSKSLVESNARLLIGS